MDAPTDENILTIRGEKQSDDAGQPAPCCTKNATMENGLLHVDLVRELPEAMKPRAIAIANSGKLLEAEAAKAAA